MSNAFAEDLEQSGVQLIAAVASSIAPRAALYTFAAGTYVSGELTVLQFRGREGLSRPYSFDVSVAAEGMDERLIDATLLGQPASLVMNLPSAPRAFHGVIAAVRVEGALVADDRHRLRLRLVPALWALKRRRNSRIFQDKRVHEVVDCVLDEAGIPRRWLLTGSRYPIRAYCVQHEESDYDFVTRILAEAGIFFYFEQPPAILGEGVGALLAKETLVFADDPAFYRAIPEAGGPSIGGVLSAIGVSASASVSVGDAKLGVRLPSPTIPFRDAEGMNRSEEAITSVSLESVVRPRAACFRDYDPDRPLTSMASRATAAPSVDLAVPGFGVSVSVPAPIPGAVARDGEVYDHHGEYLFPNRPDTEAKAGRLLEQIRRRACVVAGTSLSGRLAAGATFTLSDHAVHALNREYVVTRIEHFGVSPEHVGAARAVRPYRNRFECVPSTVCYRPRPPRRRARQVCETAVVVGPAGEEIFVDALGRIKVQFHWDREGRKNEHSSCWMRVMQAWAGAGWGTQFIPRVGSEVLVTFEGGDADKPIVLGCLYNGTHPTAIAVPGDKTRSGIRTASTPGGHGFNELTFQDAAGHEEIAIHAQRDMNVHVVEAETLTVGTNRSVAVTHDQHERVGGHHDHIVAGTQTSHVSGDRRATTFGNADHVVRGSLHTEACGQMKLVAHERHDLEVLGTSSAVIGTKTKPGHHNTYVFGSHVTGASESIELTADKEIVLCVGDTKLTVGRAGITLSAATIKVEASKSIAMASKGPSLKLDETLEILSKKVRILSEGASITLDKEATLKGENVKLNCGGDDKPEKPDDKKDPETKKVKMRLTDYAYQPYANKTFHLHVGGKVLEGKTDADGKIDKTVPKSETAAQLVLWTGDYPDGERRQYALDLKPHDPPKTPKGAQERLRALGYYRDAVTDTMTPSAVRALRTFQSDCGLEPTGEIDDKTAETLASLAGS